jgi:hypothetical protein
MNLFSPSHDPLLGHIILCISSDTGRAETLHGRDKETDMPLSAVMDSIDDLADPLKELYTEKNGRYELTGITGVFTQGNIDRLQTALNKERGDHAKTKESLSVWGEMSHGS